MAATLTPERTAARLCELSSDARAAVLLDAAGAIAGWSERRISRDRRRTRFRTTAEPTRRPVDKPNRVRPRSLRTKRATTRGCTLLWLDR